MEKLLDEQTEKPTEAVNTEREEAVTEKEVSLGKFKDVGALLSAYNSLQSEFTKRCQRVKELEGELSEEKTKVPFDTGIEKVKEIPKEEYIKEYLKGVLGTKQKAIILEDGGIGIKTPSEKPKSISEAGMLAKELLKKQEK